MQYLKQIHIFKNVVVLLVMCNCVYSIIIGDCYPGRQCMQFLKQIDIFRNVVVLLVMCRPILQMEKHSKLLLNSKYRCEVLIIILVSRTQTIMDLGSYPFYFELDFPMNEELFMRVPV